MVIYFVLLHLLLSFLSSEKMKVFKHRDSRWNLVSFLLSREQRTENISLYIQRFPRSLLYRKKRHIKEIASNKPVFKTKKREKNVIHHTWWWIPAGHEDGIRKWNLMGVQLGTDFFGFFTFLKSFLSKLDTRIRVVSCRVVMSKCRVWWILNNKTAAIYYSHAALIRWNWFSKWIVMCIQGHGSQ